MAAGPLDRQPCQLPCARGPPPPVRFARPHTPPLPHPPHPAPPSRPAHPRTRHTLGWRAARGTRVPCAPRSRPSSPQPRESGLEPAVFTASARNAGRGLRPRTPRPQLTPSASQPTGGMPRIPELAVFWVYRPRSTGQLQWLERRPPRKGKQGNSGAGHLRGVWPSRLRPAALLGYAVEVGWAGAIPGWGRQAGRRVPRSNAGGAGIAVGGGRRLPKVATKVAKLKECWPPSHGVAAYGEAEAP